MHETKLRRQKPDCVADQSSVETDDAEEMGNSNGSASIFEFNFISLYIPNRDIRGLAFILLQHRFSTAVSLLLLSTDS